jgi:hypothetical protein
MDHRNSPLRVAAALGFEELRWSATPWAGGGNNSSASIQLADAGSVAATPTTSSPSEPSPRASSIASGRAAGSPRARRPKASPGARPTV